MPNYHNPHAPQPTNHTGTVGFALMILGLFSCGIMAIPAFFVCIYSLFGDEDKPRTLPIIGAVLSVPAVIIGLPILFLFFVPLIAMQASTIKKLDRPTAASNDPIAPEPRKEIRINAGEGEIVITPEEQEPKPYGSRPGSRFPITLPTD